LIGTRIGRYVVDGWVGQGGMATVWRVVDERGEPWALKVISLRRPEVRSRFLAEGRVQLELSHPNVVTARELLEVDGEPALVLEYVPGPSLDRYLQEREPPFEVRDALALQILDGVAHAHARNLVHRDLKPANVLVLETPAGPIAKLTDFGLVKQLGQSATRTGIALGTPRYMAPEQIRDAKRVDARADIWSLGTLLYEVYTDRSPFHRDTLLEMFTAVADGQYQDPGDFGVPERVRDAIRACLHVDPGLRVQTVPALRRLLTGEARPQDVVPRSRAPSVAPPPLPAHLGTPAPAEPRAPYRTPTGAPTVLVGDDPVPPPPPPVPRSTAAPAPTRSAARWVVPWVTGWLLALLLVLAVLGGGTALVAAWVVGDALTGDEAPAGASPSAPRPRRWGRR
jgi:serine/threonine protein kinase